MKKNLSIKLITLAVCTSSISFATTAPGEFFKLKESGGILPVSVTVHLCLNGVKKLSCQKYTVSHTNLSITTIPNHVYPIAGITHNTSGIQISGCIPHSNGFCIFSVSNTQSATVSVAPTSGRPVVAVGSYTQGKLFPLSYYSSNNGQAWTPSLPPFQGSGNSELNSVTCDSKGQTCTAVGYYIPIHEVAPAPFSYYSSNGGQTWTASFPPFDIPSVAFLYGVACDSTGQRCTAVGYYFNGINQTSLSYFSSNGGKTWTISFPPHYGSGDNELLSTTCDSTGQRCTAVGIYANNGTLAPLTYYSSNGGHTWTPSIPRFQGSGASQLNGVACDSTGQTCTAVGYYNSGPPLSYLSSDGGKTWTASFPPPLKGFCFLKSVACDSTGQICTAVGQYTASNTTPGVPLSYYTSNGGKTWSLSLPPPQASGLSGLNGVNCDTTGQRCTAVGVYNPKSFQFPLAYYSNDAGKTWHPSFPQPQGSGENSLNGVA